MVLENPLSQSKLPFTMFGLLLFLLFLSCIWRKRRSGDRKTAPPEASGAWPFIGHLHLLNGSKPPHVILGNMADKYGPIFTVQLGVHKTLVVSNSEMAKQCFTVNDKAFASRPKSLAFEVLGYNYSMVGSSPYGSYWRHVRKIVTLQLLSNHRIKKFKHMIESEVKTAIRDSYNRTSNSGTQTVTTEMKKWFGDIAHNIVFRMMVGERFVGGDSQENERIRKTMRDLIDLAGSFAVSDALPYLRWLDLDGLEKEMKKTAKELDDIARFWLHKHKQKRNNNSNSQGSGEWKGEHDDFMDVLLSILDEGGDHQFYGRDVDTTIKATCLALVIAGTDTTTGTLTWALSLILNNQEVLNKAKHELDTQIGRENMVQYSDLKKLEYLEAILKETLRLYPAAPLNLPHESTEDCTVGGYHVPAGTHLLTNISKLQRDPLIYPYPLEFRPERFLTTHDGVDIKGQHFELIPFGAGRRMCPGVSLASKIMQFTLATLLHGFDIVTPDGGPVDMVEQIGLTNTKATPLHVILTPRLSAHVYSEI